MKTSSTPGAVQKVQDAMELVEEAQGVLELACQKLSSVRHGSDLYERSNQLSDECQRFWFRLQDVSQTRQKMSLDSEPEVK